MNFIKKIRQRRLRKQLVQQAGFNLMEAPFVEKWINGDDTVVEDMQNCVRERSRFNL